MSSRQIPPAQTARKTWTLPILLNTACVVGLTAALVGDGLWDAVSWVALGVLLVPVARAMVSSSTTK